MPNFFLVDSNIAGTGGHYLEYAEQVLEVAHAQGFDCHLITNCAFRPPAVNDIYTVHPVVSLDMWGRNLAVDIDKGNEFSADDRRYLRHFYSHAGLLWTASGELSATQHYSSATTLPSRFARRLHRTHQIRTKVEKALANTPDVTSLGARTQEELRSRRYGRVWDMIGRQEELPAAWPDGSIALANMERGSAAADGYAAAVAKVFAGVGLSADDHVFIPTLSLAEARAIRDVLLSRADLRRPHWSLLFRRDVFEGYRSTWRQQQWRVHEARNLFASFRRLPDRARIAFLTDTDHLTHQYNELDSVPFSTTVVPVRRAPEMERRLAPPHRALKVLVLRDNANDYGISYLATCLEGMDAAELRQLSVVVPGSSLEAHRPVDPQWVQTSRARLRLFHGDILTVGGPKVEIEDLIDAADLVVLIEWPGVRISSFEPFRELLSKHVVVVSAGSVMGAALQADGHEALVTFGERDSAEGTAHEVLSSLRAAISICGSESSQEDSWVIGYLGDARAEKGFHLLPGLIKELRFARPATRSIRLDTQIYHPNPGSDIRMLTAIETLRQEHVERVKCVEGALDSDDYLALISGSDIIFNMYERGNYVSRSSGVFVEALAAAKPVITTAGTWMSALMGDWAKPYHDAVLAGARILDVSVLRDKTDWLFVGGALPPVVASDKTMKLRPGYSICQIERRPASATHLRLELSCISDAPDNPLRVIAAWHDARGITFEEEFLELNRTSSGIHSLILEVPEDARAIWLGYSLREDNRPVTMEQSQITWLQCEAAVARQPGGVAVSQDSNALTARIARSVVHMCENYSVYRHSAEWVRDHWAGAQVAEALVDQLLNKRALPDSEPKRFIGTEW